MAAEQPQPDLESKPELNIIQAIEIAIAHETACAPGFFLKYAARESSYINDRCLTDTTRYEK